MAATLTSHLSNQGSAMVGSTELRTMYPPADLKRLKKAGREELELHYLIALGKGDKLLAAIPKASVKLLTAKDPMNHFLTPIHLAVMKRDIKSVQLLLESMKAKKLSLQTILNVKDSSGWTPLHHAVYDKEIRKVLKENGADRTVLWGTPRDIKCLAGQVKSEGGKHIFLEIEEKLVPFNELSAEDMQKYTGLKRWLDHPYYSPNYLNRLWKQPKEGRERGIDKEERRKFEDYLKNPPQLIVGRSQNLPGQWRLVTKNPLQEGAFAFEYTGVVEDNPHLDPAIEGEYALFEEQCRQDTEYVCVDRNGKTEGNAGRFANCDFPNVQVINVISRGALRVVAQVIKKGGLLANEEITFNYGLACKSLSLGTMKLGKREELRQVFKEGFDPIVKQYNKFEQLQTRLLSLTPPQELAPALILESGRIEEILGFALSMTSVLLDLVFSETVNVVDCFKLSVSFSPFIETWRGQYPFDHHYIHSFLYDLCGVEDALNRNKLLKPQVAKWVLDHIGVLDTPTIMHALFEIKKSAFSGQLNHENWPAYQSTLENQRQTYQWKKDPEGTLSLKHLVESTFFIDSAGIPLQRFLAQVSAGEKNAMEEGTSAKNIRLLYVRALKQKIQDVIEKK